MPVKKKHNLSGVGSIGFTSDVPLLSAAFNKFMSDLLRTSARDLYRSKGVLCFAEEGDAKFIFQGVHEQIQYTTAKEPWGEGERVTKVVLIGRNLDAKALADSWEACKAKPAGERSVGQGSFVIWPSESKRSSESKRPSMATATTLIASARAYGHRPPPVLLGFEW